jgi:hypothetical protein
VIPVLILNLALIGVSIVLPNRWHMYHSCWLYAIQFVTMVPYLTRRAYFAKHLFIPSFFTLVYFLANLALGGFLVPRDYGWNKNYTDVARTITSYAVLVPYLLAANTALFLVTCQTIRELGASASPNAPVATRRRSLPIALAIDAMCLGVFTLITLLDVYSAFAFQLAILIPHLTDLARQRPPRRFLVYAAYLLVFVAWNFDNKRELAMVLFLVAYLECAFGGYRLRLRARSLAAATAFVAGFMGLVVTASVLRGYGGSDAETLLDAVTYVPQYVRSDLFIDGLTDNLELNYNYGAAVNAIELGMTGRIPLQLGGSIWKALWMPVPRSVFPEKPESIMQIYTRVYAPDQASIGGSLPVSFSSEMFLNFNVLGLIPFTLVWLLINRMYLRCDRGASGTFAHYSCVFLCITILMFARGSGLEQWLFYYALAVPILAFAVVVQRSGHATMHAVRDGVRIVPA